jgi:hypothetical protein
VDHPGWVKRLRAERRRVAPSGVRSRLRASVTPGATSVRAISVGLARRASRSQGSKLATAPCLRPHACGAVRSQDCGGADNAPSRNPTAPGRRTTRPRRARVGRPLVPTRSARAGRPGPRLLRPLARAPSARRSHPRRLPALGARARPRHLAAGDELEGFLARDGEHDRRAALGDWRRRLVDRGLAPSTVNLALAAATSLLDSRALIAPRVPHVEVDLAAPRALSPEQRRAVERETDP